MDGRCGAAILVVCTVLGRQVGWRFIVGSVVANKGVKPVRAAAITSLAQIEFRAHGTLVALSPDIPGSAVITVNAGMDRVRFFLGGWMKDSLISVSVLELIKGVVSVMARCVASLAEVKIPAGGAHIVTRPVPAASTDGTAQSLNIGFSVDIR